MLVLRSADKSDFLAGVYPRVYGALVDTQQSSFLSQSFPRKRDVAVCPPEVQILPIVHLTCISLFKGR